MADEEAKDKAAVELDGEAACGKEGRVENRSNRKTIRRGFQPKRRKIHMGADRPGPTRPKPDLTEIDRTIPITYVNISDLPHLRYVYITRKPLFCS